jgi:hypothetical protein
MKLNLKGGWNAMKRITIILLTCIFLLTLTLVGYSYTYSIDINNLYKLKCGAKIIPVIKELCTIEGIDYLYFPELIDKKSIVKNSILVYIPPLRTTTLGDEIDYANVFLLIGYITIQKDH